ncbi:MAG TPA: GntR family transcriptional regulator [Xanthobacteraceae bacterium]|nr:GntR family transcriptional regulator [Xanthobacteraceae bacterium]
MKSIDLSLPRGHYFPTGHADSEMPIQNADYRKFAGKETLKSSERKLRARKRTADRRPPSNSPAASSSFLTTLDRNSLHTGSRADFVYQSLRNAIWEGRFAKGERIREEDIAQSLGVSRTPVREALQRLQRRGLLVIRAGRGFAVAQLSNKQIFDLYAVREILEGSAARFAAQHATETEIAVLYQLQKQLAKEGRDLLALVTLNRRFHQHIYEATHNQYLLETLEVLNDSMALLQNLTFQMPSRHGQSDIEHLRIVRAIEKRDQDGAEKAARHHIQQALKCRLEYFTADEA